MLHHWLIITVSWFGSVSLQYINTGVPSADIGSEPMDNPQYMPYMNYAPPARNDFDPLQNIDPLNEQFYQRDDIQADLQRKRRTSDEKDDLSEKRWSPNLVDVDKAEFLDKEEQGKAYVAGYAGTGEENGTANDIMDPMEKKYFSPWGGKRDKPTLEHMWSWKRANNIREPSMPKRVRFSPWGGKRSGQMVYKPGSKSSRIIYSTTMPELTRIVSNYSPNAKRLNFAGFQFIPTLDKRHPIKILALSTKVNDRTLRDALPFKSFLESLPKLFKPGHPYLDVNLKKDGKRKVKFSAWGGKRSPPIIGPIWTPATEELKDSTLDTIVLIRKSKDTKDEQKAS
ncbi:uncharacterized protein LOC142982074 [Anticarsia gemmatalis]|uniref:uncharacterized protein LOC142982074 n=1 Tax=Anticarsia gemmatalis TaxID=129554 RepID=UPI003F773918